MPDPSPPGRPRVLYVTHRVPFPPDKGDRIRNYHVLRELARRADVSLVALADEPVPAGTVEALHAVCAEVAVAPVGRRSRWARAVGSALAGGSLSEGLFDSPAAHRVVADWAGRMPFAAAVVSAAPLAGYLRHPALAGGPRVIDLVDVDSQKWLDFAAATAGPQRYMYRFEGRRVRKLEASLPAWAAAVTVVSPAEAAVYDGFTRPGAAAVATNGVDLDYYSPVPAATPVTQALAFVGAMDYRPNVDAAVWFVGEVWPLVRAEFPAAEFRVVGRSPVPAVRALAGVPGVVVTGSVPDVRPFVASAAAAAVPMRLSRGLQNKVLEAMAMAKPVIAGPPALAALAVEPGTHLLSATTPAEWLAAVRTVFASAADRHRLGAAGREYVEARHRWDQCLTPLMDAVLPPGRADRA